MGSDPESSVAAGSGARFGDSALVGDTLPGAPLPTIFLHGLRSVRDGEKSRALFADHQARGLCAHRVDLLGHGDSPGAVGRTTLTEHVDQLGRLLQVTGPARIFGSSFGGLVGAWTAARFPELVRGLTLLAPAFGFLPRLLASRGPDGSSEMPNSQGPVRFEPEVLADFESHDEMDLADRLECPLLIVHGSDDDVVPLSAVQNVADRRATRPGSALWVLHRGDHRLAEPIESVLSLSARFHGLGTGRT